MTRARRSSAAPGAALTRPAAFALASALFAGAVLPGLAAAADDGELGRWRGSWREEAVLPLAPRTGASVAVAPATRLGITVWGGTGSDGQPLADGVEVDAADPARTRSLPPAPLAARTEHGWTSHGEYVYVWGGVDVTEAALDDGAEFGSVWRSLPIAPLPAGAATMTVVEDTLWVVVRDPATAGAVIASIQVPLADGRDWSPLEAVPVPAGQRYQVVGCCDEEARSLIVVSLAADGLASAAWRELPDGPWNEAVPVPVGPVPVAGPAVGRALEDDRAAWLGWLPGRDVVTAEPTASLLALRHPDAPWIVSDGVSGVPGPTGTDTLVLGPSQLVWLDGLRAYDLVERRWLRLPRLDHPGWSEAISGGTAWWDRGKLWVLAAPAAGDEGVVLWSFTPKPPPGSRWLPTGRRRSSEPKPCVLYGERGTWRLRGDERDPRLVWLQRGRRQVELDWPDGWHVRFDPRLVILDAADAVRYRGGQTCPAVTGTGG